MCRHSNTRSEPDVCAGLVYTASPPASLMASMISISAQATIVGPTSASKARRQTWTIIGSPAISANGLPGSRVEASRAGITTIGFAGAPTDELLGTVLDDIMVANIPWLAGTRNPLCLKL